MKFHNALLGLLLLAAPVAHAADDFDYHIASVVLLQLKEVQTELKITEAQRAKMNKHAETHRGKLTDYSKQLDQRSEAAKKQVGPDEAKLSAMFDELKKKVLAELSAAQIKRLREISLQQVGFAALNDSLVATKVGLNKDQLERIRRTFESGFREAEELERGAVQKAIGPYKDRKPKDGAEEKKLYEEVQKKADQARDSVSARVDKIREFTKSKIMGILTPQQKQAFTALQGKPFKVKSAK